MREGWLAHSAPSPGPSGHPLPQGPKGRGRAIRPPSFGFGRSSFTAQRAITRNERASCRLVPRPTTGGVGRSGRGDHGNAAHGPGDVRIGEVGGRERLIVADRLEGGPE